MIIISELASCFTFSLIIFCLFIIILTVILNSFTFMIDFLIITYHLNHFFDFLNLNYMIISALFISFFSIFLVTLSSFFYHIIILNLYLIIISCYYIFNIFILLL